MLSGLHDSDLILIAARPGMGKTTFMLNIAQYAAINRKVPVAVFNLEMSNEQLATRMLSSVSQVASEKLRSGQIRTMIGQDLLKLWVQCRKLNLL